MKFENKKGCRISVITDAESAVKCSEWKEETFIPFHYKSTLNGASPVSVLVGVSLSWLFCRAPANSNLHLMAVIDCNYCLKFPVLLALACVLYPVSILNIHYLDWIYTSHFKSSQTWSNRDIIRLIKIKCDQNLRFNQN